jgi:5-(carboxyamino)imidazole ribonucleotide synthase
VAEVTSVGIVGGGQLGRMLALAGLPLGIHTTVLDPSGEACAAAAADLILAPYDDLSALAQLAQRSDVVTFEFENVPAGAARELEAAVRVAPGAAALEASQDRLTEKTLFEKLGIPTARFAPAEDATQLAAAVESVGAPALVKTRRLGYDGKGQARIDSAGEAGEIFTALGDAPVIVESLVPFARELSQVSVRSKDGEIRHYPLVENVHRDGILRQTHAPADRIDESTAATAREHVERLMRQLEYVGVLALELFEHDNELLANEFAPRVHNTGHWTIDGAVCSQFENHLRAITGLPLGDTSARETCVMLNLVGGVPPTAQLAATPAAHVHLYGKQARPGRKIGHVTLTGAGDEFEQRLAALRELVDSHSA